MISAVELLLQRWSTCVYFDCSCCRMTRVYRCVGHRRQRVRLPSNEWWRSPLRRFGNAWRFASAPRCRKKDISHIDTGLQCVVAHFLCGALNKRELNPIKLAYRRLRTNSLKVVSCLTSIRQLPVPLLHLSFMPSLIAVILCTINSLRLNYPVSNWSRTLLLVLPLKLRSPVISLLSYTLSTGSESLNASITSSSRLPAQFLQLPNLHIFITSSLFNVLASTTPHVVTGEQQAYNNPDPNPNFQPWPFQQLINSSLAYTLSILQISWKSTHNVLKLSCSKQTNKQRSI